APVGCAKGDMHPAPRRTRAGREPKRWRMRWAKARARSILGAHVMAECAQGSGIEAHARVQVLNLQADVFVHGWTTVLEITLASQAEAVLGESCARRAPPAESCAAKRLPRGGTCARSWRGRRTPLRAQRP